MSDAPVESGGVPAEGAASVEGGVGEPEATAPSPEYLDTESYGGHHVRLKVDGQDLEVPLSEALSGYSRQADYTRKTQELADLQRQAQFGLTLQQALEANPAETLRILQGQYTAPEEATPPQYQVPPELAPEDVRYQDVEARLARFEQQQADNELRQAIGVLQTRYGDDFNPQEVVQTAFTQNRTDLEAVYKEMAFDRYWKGQQAAKDQLASEEAARVTAKSQASETIHSGNGAANSVESFSDSHPTIEQAFAEAKRQLGA